MGTLNCLTLDVSQIQRVTSFSVLLGIGPSASLCRRRNFISLVYGWVLGFRQQTKAQLSRQLNFYHLHHLLSPNSIHSIHICIVNASMLVFLFINGHTRTHRHHIHIIYIECNNIFNTTYLQFERQQSWYATTVVGQK